MKILKRMSKVSLWQATAPGRAVVLWEQEFQGSLQPEEFPRNTFDFLSRVDRFSRYRLMFVFSICRLVTRRCYSLSNMCLLAPAAQRTRPTKSCVQYHNFFGNNIIDNQPKSCIFVEVDDLWSTGRSPHFNAPACSIQKFYLRCK